MEQLEEGMTANTLFTDDAFIKDSKILGDLSKSTFSDLFPAQQKGIWRTISWKLTCGKPTKHACCRRAKSNSKNVLVEVCCRKKEDEDDEAKILLESIENDKHGHLKLKKQLSETVATSTICGCFKVCCFFKYVKSERNSTVKDLARSNSKLFSMLRKLPNWDEGIDYEEHEEDKVTIQSLYGTKECF